MGRALEAVVRAPVVALGLVLVSACGGGGGGRGARDDGPRYLSRRDHFSIRALGDGWEERRELGSVVFRGPAGTSAERTTIAVRVVGRAPDGWVGERNAGTVVATTAKILAALPVAAELEAVPCPLTGAAFAVTFTPPARPGARTRRRHVVIVGRQRVFHLIHTCPAGEPASAALFDELVRSFREEV